MELAHSLMKTFTCVDIFLRATVLAERFAGAYGSSSGLIYPDTLVSEQNLPAINTALEELVGRPSVSVHKRFKQSDT